MGWGGAGCQLRCWACLAQNNSGCVQTRHAFQAGATAARSNGLARAWRWQAAAGKALVRMRRGRRTRAAVGDVPPEVVQLNLPEPRKPLQHADLKLAGVHAVVGPEGRRGSPGQGRRRLGVGGGKGAPQVATGAWRGTPAPQRGEGLGESPTSDLMPQRALLLAQAGCCSGCSRACCCRRGPAHSMKGSPRLLMQYFCRPSSGP